MLTEPEVRTKRKLLAKVDRSLATTFKALGDTTRLHIFHLLIDEPQIISVSTIARILHLSTPLVSQHLKVLVHAGILQKQRAGKNIFSKLDRERVVVRELIRVIRQTGKTTP